MSRQTLQRIFASVLLAGGMLLIGRILILLSQGALTIYKPWVTILLFAELAVDTVCLFVIIQWWRRPNASTGYKLLLWVSAVVILHAVRVLVFILGRTGPWFNLDLKNAEDTTHHLKWTSTDVYLAGSLAGLSLVLLAVFWILRRKRPESP